MESQSIRGVWKPGRRKQTLILVKISEKQTLSKSNENPHQSPFLHTGHKIRDAVFFCGNSTCHLWSSLCCPCMKMRRFWCYMCPVCKRKQMWLPSGLQIPAELASCSGSQNPADSFETFCLFFLKSYSHERLRKCPRIPTWGPKRVSFLLKTLRTKPNHKREITEKTCGPHIFRFLFIVLIFRFCGSVLHRGSFCCRNYGTLGLWHLHWVPLGPQILHTVVCGFTFLRSVLRAKSVSLTCTGELVSDRACVVCSLFQLRDQSICCHHVLEQRTTTSPKSRLRRILSHCRSEVSALSLPQPEAECSTRVECSHAGAALRRRFSWDRAFPVELPQRSCWTAFHLSALNLVDKQPSLIYVTRRRCGKDLEKVFCVLASVIRYQFCANKAVV